MYNFFVTTDYLLYFPSRTSCYLKTYIVTERDAMGEIKHDT
ncbi:hypothetical protein PPEP_a2714 [Pseudoalteromonas peptidolytica F12-50-A1]|uniref:Uncharacterized protein n=1 Tax=Pseudoalteromonas peptidolytica F12-50-A1 TaxID=1315280 RepID=A0A8I0MSI6_9GAMM|nr:hypothetical protein [Pseudoalteromonas peptidolytica F12-50-A1]